MKNARKNLLAAALVLLPVPAARAAESRRLPVGAVQKIEVTALTKDRIALWVRVALAEAPRGASQTFTGKLDVANVPIPFHAPARVMVQPGGGGLGRGADAVFFLDVDLPRVPEPLLSKVNAHAVDLTLDGTLTGEKGDTVRTFAVGVLRLGTPEVRTPAAPSPEFLRLKDARLTDVSLTETSGEARVVLFNPFSFVVPIREIAYELRAGDRLLAKGVNRAVRLRARQETVVSLPLTAKNVDLAAAAGSALVSGGVVDGRLAGHVTVKVSTGDVSVPINLAGRIEVGR